jgi:uncharacterized protein YndB with AHSA1/START domain
MQVEVARTIAARPAKVFSTVADVARWPQIIGSVSRVELATSGRLRVGTQLRIGHVMFGHEVTEELTILEIERPRRLRLAGEQHGLHYERDHIIDALPTGSRLTLIFRTRPEAQHEAGRALKDFLTPFMEINLRDELEHDLADFAAAATQSAQRQVKRRPRPDQSARARHAISRR